MREAGYIRLTVKITRDEDGYSAVCEELGVATCGDSLDDLMVELHALVTQHLNALERNGTRASFFREHGIRIYRGSPDDLSRPERLPVRPGEFVTRMTERIPVLA